jgi:hypothetical protein
VTATPNRLFRNGHRVVTAEKGISLRTKKKSVHEAKLGKAQDNVLDNGADGFKVKNGRTLNMERGNR